MRKGTAKIRVGALCWVLWGLCHIAQARQVEGRPTIPSDCTAQEVWIRDHSKVIGEWTAYCRIRTGRNRSPSYDYGASRFKAGRPAGWPTASQVERSTNWQSKDVQDVFWALEHIPKALWDQRVRGIHRMLRAIDDGNPGMYWNGYIVLYDSAFQNEEYTAKVLAHELAHACFDHFSSQRKMEYAMTAGWKRSSAREQTLIPPETGFVTPVGQDSLDEHFASSVEYFLFDQEKLKNVNPRAHAWIQKFIHPVVKARRAR